jgi:transcriptional regulator with XRE-family HTH domain
MLGISKEFCLRVKEERRSRAISQSELAAAVGCKQSAISMFEQGDPTKLSDEAVQKLAEKFSLKLVDFKSSSAAEVQSFSAITKPIYTSSRGFCPNPKCPSNEQYEVEGHIYYYPNRMKADPVGGRFCAYCGEVLEKVCPNCQKPLHDGGICSFCATPYIAS